MKRNKLFEHRFSGTYRVVFTDDGHEKVQDHVIYYLLDDEVLTLVTDDLESNIYMLEEGEVYAYELSYGDAEEIAVLVDQASFDGYMEGGDFDEDAMDDWFNNKYEALTENHKNTKYVEVDIFLEDGVTAQDVLRTFKKAYPNLTFKIVTLKGPGGGWPVFKITGDEADIIDWLLKEYDLAEDEATDYIEAFN